MESLGWLETDLGQSFHTAQKPSLVHRHFPQKTCLLFIFLNSAVTFSTSCELTWRDRKPPSSPSSLQMPQVKTGTKELGWAVHSSVDFLSKVNEGWERKCRFVQDNEETHPLTSSTSCLISQKVAGDKEEFSKLEMGSSWSCSARESKRGKAADKAALPGTAMNGPEFVHSKVKAGEIIYHYLSLKGWNAW